MPSGDSIAAYGPSHVCPPCRGPYRWDGASPFVGGHEVQVIGYNDTGRLVVLLLCRLVLSVGWPIADRTSKQLRSLSALSLFSF